MGPEHVFVELLEGSGLESQRGWLCSAASRTPGTDRLAQTRARGHRWVGFKTLGAAAILVQLSTNVTVTQMAWYFLVHTLGLVFPKLGALSWPGSMFRTKGIL